MRSTPRKSNSNKKSVRSPVKMDESDIHIYDDNLQLIASNEMDDELLRLEEELLQRRCEEGCEQYFGANMLDCLPSSPESGDVAGFFANLEQEYQESNIKTLKNVDIQTCPEEEGAPQVVDTISVDVQTCPEEEGAPQVVDTVSIDVQTEAMVIDDDSEVHTPAKDFIEVPCLSVQPPITSEESNSDHMSVSSFRFPRTNMSESVGDNSSHAGDMPRIDISDRDDVMETPAKKRPRDDGDGIFEDAPEKDDSKPMMNEDRHPEKLWEAGEVSWHESRATNFLVTWTRVHKPLDNACKEWNNDFYCKGFPKAAEVIGVYEWGFANGNEDMTPHAHFLISYAYNVKPAPNQVFNHACNALVVHYSHRDCVNVQPITRYRDGITYITKYLKGKVKGLFDPVYRETKSTYMYTDWEQPGCKHVGSPRVWIATNTVSSIETIKNHIETAKRCNLSGSTSTDSDGSPNGSSKKNKKAKLDVASMTVPEIWEVLKEFPEISDWEDIRKDEMSISLWITSLYRKLKDIGSIKESSLCDKVLVLAASKGVDTAKLIYSASLHSSIRGFLADKRRTVNYGTFMPKDQFPFPDIQGLIEKYRTRHVDKIERAIALQMQVLNQSREVVLQDPKLFRSVEKLNAKMLKFSPFFLWLKSVVKAHTTGRVKRNRHMYLYGAGTNGKSSFKRFLDEKFLVQTHSVNHQFLTTVPDQRPCHIYIFDEFDPRNHIGKDSKFRFNYLNNMLGEESKDLEQYHRILGNPDNWPGPNVKSHTNCRTNPFVFCIFFSNIPMLEARDVPRVEERLIENFRERMKFMMDLRFGEFIPEELCSFAKGAKDSKPYHKMESNTIEKKLIKSFGFESLISKPEVPPDSFGYDQGKGDLRI